MRKCKIFRKRETELESEALYKINILSDHQDRVHEVLEPRDFVFGGWHMSLVLIFRVSLIR